MDKIIKKGQMFITSSGVYSDYGVTGVFKALTNINIEGFKNEYLEKYPDQKKEYEFDDDKFINWLTIIKKSAKEVPTIEWHLDDYSSPDFSLYGLVRDSK